MHSLKDNQFWLCYFLFIVPVVKNDLKLCVNHQFIAPSLYNQITQLIFITYIRYLGYVLLRYVLIYKLEVSFNFFFLSAIFFELPITRTPVNSNLFSISLQGSSYRKVDCIIDFLQLLSWVIS